VTGFFIIHPITTRRADEIFRDEYRSFIDFVRCIYPGCFRAGSPYEIGLAHGKLCKKEILTQNKPFFDIYEEVSLDPKHKWLEVTKRLEKHIPKEYLEEMRGIADGAEIRYEKILFLNMLTTISMGNRCFAFAFKENSTKIVTVRQIDNDMNKTKALELVRSARISWRWNPVVHNRQSIIFSPATLDFWIAIPPESDYIPASYGPYVGFNLLQELYGTGHEPNPESFPAY
jgi:hypothetical protein